MEIRITGGLIHTRTHRHAYKHALTHMHTYASTRTHTHAHPHAHTAEALRKHQVLFLCNLTMVPDLQAQPQAGYGLRPAWAGTDTAVRARSV